MLSGFGLQVDSSHNQDVAVLAMKLGIGWYFVHWHGTLLQNKIRTRAASDLVPEVCTERQLLFAVVQHSILASLALGPVTRVGLHGSAEVGKCQHCHLACVQQGMC